MCYGECFEWQHVGYSVKALHEAAAAREGKSAPLLVEEGHLTADGITGSRRASSLAS